MPGVWPSREASTDAGGLNMEHMESNLCLQAFRKRIYWELATMLLPLPKAILGGGVVAAAPSGVGGKTIRRPGACAR